MAFRKYAAFFQPHELEVLNTAYNVAWERMATKPMNTAEASNLKEQACAGDPGIGMHGRA
jgi:hypothetical protein